MRRFILRLCVGCGGGGGGPAAPAANRPQLRWCGGGDAKATHEALLKLNVEELEVLLLAQPQKGMEADDVPAASSASMVLQLHGKDAHTRRELYAALRERERQRREREAVRRTRRQRRAKDASPHAGSLEFCLGMLAHMGAAGAPNDASAEALHWFHEAAVRGHVAGMNTYGQLLIKTLGDAPDESRGGSVSDDVVSSSTEVPWSPPSTERSTHDGDTAAGEFGGASTVVQRDRDPLAASLRPPVYPKKPQVITWVDDSYETDDVNTYSEAESIPAFSNARAEGRYWIEKAARADWGPAQHNLAMLLCAEAGNRATDDVIRWLTKAAEEHGDADAMNQLGLFEGNDARAFAWFKRCAETAGHADAANNLAHCYEHGVGTARDVHLAVAWYSEAINGWNVRAMHNLGHLYLAEADAEAPTPGLAGLPRGGVARETRAAHLKQSALRLFVSAAEHGYVEAQAMVGFCYQQSIGTRCDMDQAVRWWESAGAAGHASACNNLGVCHLQGAGVPRDAAKAVWWFRKAAGQDHPQATAMLASCTMRGEGVERDIPGGLQLMHRAADLGSIDAKRALVSMH